jgi:hypothetical protein
MKYQPTVTNFLNLYNGVIKDKFLVDFSKGTYKFDGSRLTFSDNRFTERGEKQFCRLLHVPRKLLKESSETLLNNLIQERITLLNQPAYHIYKVDNEISMVLPAPHEALRLEEILPLSKAHVLWGNPLDDEYFRVVFKETDLDVRGESLVVGISAKVPMGFLGISASRCTFRTVSNSGIISARKSDSLKTDLKNGFDYTNIRALIGSLANDIPDYVTEMGNFVCKAQDTPISDPVETVVNSISESRFVSSWVLGRVKEDGEKVKAGAPEELTSKGIKSLNNLWDYVCLISFESQTLTSIPARIGAERGAFNWANVVVSSSSLVGV